MNEYPLKDNQPPQEPQQPYPQQQYPQQPYPQWQPPQQQPPTQYPPNYPPGYQSPYPPPQYTPPPPPPTKKKRGPLFWILVVLGVVLVIGVCSAVMNAASHPNASTTATTAGIKPDMTATTIAIAMATQDAVTPSPTTPPTPTIQKVGDTITLNGVDATLTNVKVGPVDQYSTPKPGYEFVTVDVKLKNNSGVEQNYNQLNFHVKSGTGNITDVDAATYGQGINDLGYGTIADGGTAEGNIVFQVKMDDHKAMLTWQPYFSGNVGDNGWLLGI
jgi:hypothetical protein